MQFSTAPVFLLSMSHQMYVEVYDDNSKSLHAYKNPVRKKIRVERAMHL